ncbi:hypothetical protein [Pseudogulbenkiania subflava]|uniref:Uncharacterized protein n=1 Tax=Pseudogulbenkiania subflava DSM 22618 TaxID=1123014 RepID=A0A1Y6CAI1_9NEIS|nr:hypothetical protein [Pseudogulbenkiania subflava]SMF53358.1 hypothetical protein SAMN02745746_03812 [Pseudogulbenkiania subflava DSM 22618]
MKTVSFWSALDLIRQAAEKGPWTGDIDALLGLIVGKSKISASYRQWLKEELQTEETVHALKRRGVDFRATGGEIRFGLFQNGG